MRSIRFNIVQYINALMQSPRNLKNSPNVVLRELLLVFITTLDLCDKNKAQIVPDITYVSKILNHHLDVHKKIREAAKRDNIIELIEDEFESFYEECIESDEDERIINLLIEEIKRDKRIEESVVKEIENAKDDPIEFFLKTCLVAVKMPNIFGKEKYNIWKEGNRSINLVSDDLFAVAKRQKKKIVVIPVDTTFETEITKDGEHTVIHLVSETTLHGKWLEFMRKEKVMREQIDSRILDYLKAHSIEPTGESSKATGKKNLYPIGTIVVIEEKLTIYYLLAISDFNSRCKAETTKQKIADSIVKMIEFYDENGQGYPLYMPLLGTGMSRCHLSSKESFYLISGTLKEHKTMITGEMNIVAYGETIDEIKGEEKDGI